MLSIFIYLGFTRHWYFTAICCSSICVCLLRCFFCPTPELFTHMETSPLPVKGCKFWTWAVRVLKRDTGHPFIMVISEDPWHSHLLPSVWKWSCRYLFLRLSLSRLGFEHPTFCLRGESSSPLHHRRGWSALFIHVEASLYILERIRHIFIDCDF